MTSAIPLVLLSVSLGQQPASPSSGAEIRDPVWVASWGNPPVRCENIFPMVTLPGSFKPATANESVNPETLARQLKSSPKGRRSLLLSRYCPSFWGARQDSARTATGDEFPSPWADAAIADIAKEWPRMLALVKYCGADIDLLVADFEDGGCLGTWWMKAPQIDAVRADPRWTQGRLGLAPLSEAMRELDGVPPAKVRAYPQFLKWNLEMGRYAAAHYNAALWKPAKEAFPGLRGSNYEGVRVLDAPPPDLNGHEQPVDAVFGTGAAPALYGTIAQAADRWIDPAKPTHLSASGAARLGRGPWQSFLLCQQQARSCVRNAPEVELMPWIANLSYQGDDPKQYLVGFPLDPRCYDENVRHAALLGVRNFLWWRASSASTAAETERLDRLISEFNAVALGRIVKPSTADPVDYRTQVLVSGGQRHDGKWLWRVTASPDVAKLKDPTSGVTVDIGPENLGFWRITDTAEAPRFEVAARREVPPDSAASP